MNEDAEEHLHGYVDDYLDDLSDLLEELRPQFHDVFPAMADAFDEARRNGNTVYTMGNGGSGAEASHIANDLQKLTITEGEARYKCVSLVDNMPVVLAWANDQAYEDVFVEQLKNLLEPGDVVLGISGSGNSENCVRALQYAREVGATTVSWTGFDKGKMAPLSDHHIHIPSHSMVRCEDCHVIIHHAFISYLKSELDRRQGEA